MVLPAYMVYGKVPLLCFCLTAKVVFLAMSFPSVGLLQNSPSEEIPVFPSSSTQDNVSLEPASQITDTDWIALLSNFESAWKDPMNFISTIYRKAMKEIGLPLTQLTNFAQEILEGQLTNFILFFIISSIAILLIIMVVWLMELVRR